jgi:site-specific recombinase XerD
MLTVNPDFGTLETMNGRPAPDSSAVTLAVAGFLQTCRSANTQAAYRTDLRHFADWCERGDALDLLTVDAADLASYRAACELAGASPATVARRLSAITSFCGYAFEQGLEPALTASSEVERPALEPESTADVLSDAEADAMLESADEIGDRAGVLIRLLMLDGLKVGEVIRADAADFRGRPPRMTLDVAGRTAPPLLLHADTAAAVRSYLRARREGPLLFSERRGQTAQRLTRFGADYMIKQVARAAGVASPVSGNTLRRRYVVAAHARGTDLEAIRRNTGHSDQRTTRRYLTGDDANADRPPSRRSSV